MVTKTREVGHRVRRAAALSCALAAALWASAAAAQPREVSPAAPRETAPATPAAQPLEPSAAAPGKPAQESAWSRGVSPESRRAAEALFQEGNALLRESIFVSAAAKYREALARWDHPNIHFNLALALMNLDQPVETHAHLVAAMRYGPEPLQKERFEHARNYLALLEKQLTRVTIRCDVPGAQVALDGKPLFEPPGAFEGFVRAGKRTLVASKEGFVTNQSVRTLDGGTASVIELPLKTADELTVTTRRWAAWVPWSVVGAGAAVALAGGALHYSASQKVDWVDTQAKERCQVPTGCTSAQATDLVDASNQADTFQSVAIGAYIAGGVAIATGTVLAYLNRGHTTVLRYDEAPAAPPKQAALEVIPVIDPGRPGIVATIRF